MGNGKLLRRLAGILAIASAAGVLAASIVLLAAVDFDMDTVANPIALLTLDQNGLELFRWGSYLELFAPTLLIIPAALYLWYWLKPKNEAMVTTYSLFGLASVFVAALGAVLRATVWPPLITAHTQASDTQRELLAIIFEAATDFSFQGLWALDLLFWGVWWMGIGLLLRDEKRALGLLTAGLGLAFLVSGAGWMLRIEPAARLDSFFFLVPIWAVWLGLVILRHNQLPKPADARRTDQAVG